MIFWESVLVFIAYGLRILFWVDLKEICLGVDINNKCWLVEGVFWVVFICLGKFLEFE